MIHVIDGSDAARFPELFCAAQRLCAASGTIRPADHARGAAEACFAPAKQNQAVHQFCVDQGRVVGYQCMVPTLAPTGLRRLFAHLCEEPVPRAPNVYELSLHFVAPARREGLRGLSQTAAELIAGCLEWGLACGVNRILVAAEPYWVLRAMQLRFAARPLGYQHTLGRRQVIATELTFDWRTLAAVRDFRGHFDPVVQFQGALGEQLPRSLYAS